MADEQASVEAATHNGSPQPDATDGQHIPADTQSEATSSQTAPASTATTPADGSGNHDSKASKGRQISVSLRGLLAGVLIVGLIAAVGVLTWRVVTEQRDLDAQTRQSANVARAESIALDYATNAAAMNFQDLDGWKTRLVSGTSPELKDRLNNAAEQMKQILVPLQWNSTARPLAAKVRSTNGGVYDVDAFVSVMTKTAQGPDPLQSTATYRVTVDSNKNWQITDVGGIGAAVGEK